MSATAAAAAAAAAADVASVGYIFALVRFDKSLTSAATTKYGNYFKNFFAYFFP